LLRPRTQTEIVTGAGRVLLIGEAAGWVSPSSGEGISFALRSALALARSLEEGIAGAPARYARIAAPLRREIARSIPKLPCMFNPAIRGLIFRAGIGSLGVQLDQNGAACDEQAMANRWDRQALSQ